MTLISQDFFNYGYLYMSVIFLCKYKMYFTKESFYGDIGSLFAFD